MKLRIKIADWKVEEDLDEMLKIDTSTPEVLAEQLSQSPSLFFYIAAISEKLEIYRNKVLFEYEKWYSEKYLLAKEDLIKEYGKSAVNETAIKNWVMLKYEKEYETWRKKLAYIESKRQIVNDAKSAISKRHEALINLLAYYKRLLEER